MKKLIIGCMAACLLLAPTTAIAKKPADAGSKHAAKACKAERSAMGAENFALKYGSNKNRKNAFGKCVSRTTRTGPADPAELNAARQCRAEQEADPAAFRTAHGTNKNGSNAFGKCVSALAGADS